MRLPRRLILLLAVISMTVTSLAFTSQEACTDVVHVMIEDPGDLYIDTPGYTGNTTYP